jgi:flagellar FliL protein
VRLFAAERLAPALLVRARAAGRGGGEGMSDAKQPAEGEEGEAPKKGKSKLFLIIGLVVLLAGGGGAGWWFFLRTPPAAEGDAEAKGGEHGEGGGEHGEGGGGHGKASAHGDGPGAVEAIDPFIANLADEDGRRYLKATIQFEFFEHDVPAEFTQRAAQVRDVILTLLTSKTFGEIRSPQGKALLREEIINRTNHIVHRDVVKAVYFTEFIVQ